MALRGGQQTDPAHREFDPSGLTIYGLADNPLGNGHFPSVAFDPPCYSPLVPFGTKVRWCFSYLCPSKLDAPVRAMGAQRRTTTGPARPQACFASARITRLPLWSLCNTHPHA